MQHTLENATLRFVLPPGHRAKCTVTFSAKFKHRVVVNYDGFHNRTLFQNEGSQHDFSIENETMAGRPFEAYDLYDAGGRDAAKRGEYARVLKEKELTILVGWDDKDKDGDFDDAQISVAIEPIA